MPVVVHVLLLLCGAVLAFLALDAKWTLWLRVPLGLLALTMIVKSAFEIFGRRVRR